MEVKVSKKLLSEVLDLKSLEKLFTHFSVLTGIDVSLHDVEGEELIANRLNRNASMCEIVKRQNAAICKKNMAYSGMKAAELGEPYIFKCGCMVKCSAAILFEEEMLGSLSCGPVLLWEVDDLTQIDLAGFIATHELNDVDIDYVLEHTKQLSPESMTSAAQMLSVIVDYMCKEESKFLAQRLKIQNQQKEISNLLQEKKENAVSLLKIEKRAALRKYSQDLERELIAYVQTGDYASARRILNNILSEILSFSSGDLDIVKAKLYELTAILMRAGVDAGASLIDLSAVITHYSKILLEDVKFEELCIMTSEVMEKIMLVIYSKSKPKKKNKHLVRAINYIKENYADDVSLKAVAQAVYVNEYYLSHLFREEMNISFSEYVNKIRMEESLALMKTTRKTIGAIAQKVGFTDPNYFSKVFKKYYGVTPKQYRKIYE